MLGWLLETVCVRVDNKPVVLRGVNSLELLNRADTLNVSESGLALCDLGQLVEAANLI